MKTLTRIVYPGVMVASLRMRSLGDLTEHSRIRWGLFLLVACAATSSAQLTDQTLAPNTAQAGIAKSLQDEIGAGRGDSYTPAHLFSSLTVIHIVRFVAGASSFSESLLAFRARDRTKATAQVISKPTMRLGQACLIVVRCAMDAHEGRRA
jgi:hypothetical protein